ncbi:hypothetical protein DM02DRAFT_517889 [Periconia macrospinosa]|uniref:Zn(2)-C6 fungal-type domain-containing protein n=1 Tax=Periconia macrospinosa TaxID=97972 RepID=A0A2V1E3T5_9PLEO|nr:hypothetical protein DM02DRAFT_517889 [Periconia macrospinosa]
MTAPRSRLACSACTRRKVKCSKTVPCTNCTRRGEEALCGTDSNHITQQSSPQPSLSLSRAQELEYLRRRIDELQDQTVENNSNRAHQTHSPLDIRAPEISQSPRDASTSQYERQEENDATETTNDSVIQDAASILEFLAWGRRKDPDVHNIVSPEVEHTDLHENTPDPFSDCSSLTVVQLLIPSASHVQQLVDYHCDDLLWYHGSFFTPTFRTQLQIFWDRHDGKLTSPGINLQWVALLFSVMAGSLTCAPTAQAQSWGYRDTEQATLSKRWFQAVTTCLNHANYTSNLSIFSCQAIATGTISAHLLGFSSSQSIHLAAAVRVAQSLGLHRLGARATGSIIEKEIGRRVWTQLCSQDWFGIPFSESYLINPLYSTSQPASHCHDHDLVPLPLHVPTITSYCRFLYDIASIMPQLQDGLMSCNTPYTRYEQVLKWDARLRSLAIQDRPAFLNSLPLDPSWPSWIPWARRALAISSSHKIIMIHRSFLSDSFTNTAFAFTRRTCLAASKTIIKEYKHVCEENGPVLWIHQAFAVAAAIILSLDILHRDRDTQKIPEHLQLVETVVVLLRSCRNSMIATRGVRLLEALLAEISKLGSTSRGSKRNRDGTPAHAFNVPAFVKSFCEGTSTPERDLTAPSSREPPPTYSITESNQAQATNYTDFDLNLGFAPSMLDSGNGFENLLYLANHDLSGSWL